MPESIEHANLVKHLSIWVAHTYFDGDTTEVTCHGNQLIGSRRPPMINGHIPDVYARKRASDAAIVGEAKTPRDLDTSRSEQQITMFLRHCATNDDAIFVLAVPWVVERYARSLLRRLQYDSDTQNVNTFVLERIPAT